MKTSFNNCFSKLNFAATRFNTIFTKHDSKKTFDDSFDNAFMKYFIKESCNISILLTLVNTSIQNLFQVVAIY